MSNLQGMSNEDVANMIAQQQQPAPTELPLPDTNSPNTMGEGLKAIYNSNIISGVTKNLEYSQIGHQFFKNDLNRQVNDAMDKVTGKEPHYPTAQELMSNPNDLKYSDSEIEEQAKLHPDNPMLKTSGQIDQALADTAAQEAQRYEEGNPNNKIGKFATDIASSIISMPASDPELFTVPGIAWGGITKFIGYNVAIATALFAKNKPTEVALRKQEGENITWQQIAKEGAQEIGENAVVSAVLGAFIHDVHIHTASRAAQEADLAAHPIPEPEAHVEPQQGESTDNKDQGNTGIAVIKPEPQPKPGSSGGELQPNTASAVDYHESLNPVTQDFADRAVQAAKIIAQNPFKYDESTKKQVGQAVEVAQMAADTPKELNQSEHAYNMQVGMSQLLDGEIINPPISVQPNGTVSNINHYMEGRDVSPIAHPSPTDVKQINRITAFEQSHGVSTLAPDITQGLQSEYENTRLPPEHNTEYTMPEKEEVTESAAQGEGRQLAVVKPTREQVNADFTPQYIKDMLAKMEDGPERRAILEEAENMNATKHLTGCILKS